MFELVAAQDGSQILKVRERLTASRVKPREEARAWILRRQHFLQSVKTVFVLGLGSGHHIVELLKLSTAQVVVIETEPKILDLVVPLIAAETGFAADANLPERLHFIVARTKSDLRRHNLVEGFIKQSFTVLKHVPSCANQPKLYDDLSQLLLGRDWGSLSWQWRVKGLNHWHCDHLSGHIEVGSTEKALSLFDVTVLGEELTGKDRQIWGALLELVNKTEEPKAEGLS